MSKEKNHPFVRTLGEGPYKFVGCFEIIKPSESNPTGNIHMLGHLMHKNFKSGAGTCCHCGHGIANVFQVEIGNGDVYGVGSDCIEKIFDEGHVIVRAVRKVINEKARLKREAKNKEKRRKAIEQSKINQQELLKLCSPNSQTRQILSWGPHPHPHFKDKSLLDYAWYCTAYAHMSTKALALVKEFLSKSEAA